MLRFSRYLISVFVIVVIHNLNWGRPWALRGCWCWQRLRCRCYRRWMVSSNVFLDWFSQKHSLALCLRSEGSHTVWRRLWDCNITRVCQKRRRLWDSTASGCHRFGRWHDDGWDNSEVRCSNFEIGIKMLKVKKKVWRYCTGDFSHPKPRLRPRLQALKIPSLSRRPL